MSTLKKHLRENVWSSIFSSVPGPFEPTVRLSRRCCRRRTSGMDVAGIKKLGMGMETIKNTGDWVLVEWKARLNRQNIGRGNV